MFNPIFVAQHLTLDMVEEMYHVMAIANYEDRFVIPTTHRETSADAYELRGQCGFSFGDGCLPSDQKVNLFGGVKIKNERNEAGAL